MINDEIRTERSWEERTKETTGRGRGRRGHHWGGVDGGWSQKRICCRKAEGRDGGDRERTHVSTGPKKACVAQAQAMAEERWLGGSPWELSARPGSAVRAEGAPCASLGGLAQAQAVSARRVLAPPPAAPAGLFGLVSGHNAETRRTGGFQSGANSPPEPCFDFICISSAISLGLLSANRTPGVEEHSLLESPTLISQFPHLFEQNTDFDCEGLAKVVEVSMPR